MAESWLNDPSRDDSPLPVATCQRSAQRPHLDGQLNDTCWQTARKSQNTQLDTEVLLLYDEQYLYLAAICEKQKSCDYFADDTPRTYDADLSGHDRLEFSLDVDRDYTSGYRLTVD